MTTIAQELSEVVGIAPVCQALGVPCSRLYPRQQAAGSSPRATPAHALSAEERTAIRAVLNRERFMDRAPRQIYAALLDEGTYLCHWRSMYRILQEFAEVRERRDQRQHPPYRKPELLAEGPNQVWSWDISKLRGQMDAFRPVHCHRHLQPLHRRRDDRRAGERRACQTPHRHRCRQPAHPTAAVNAPCR